MSFGRKQTWSELITNNGKRITPLWPVAQTNLSLSLFLSLSLSLCVCVCKFLVADMQAFDASFAVTFSQIYDVVLLYELLPQINYMIT